MNNTTLNATEGGVNIPGATNISLREALNKHCHENNVSIASNYLKKIKQPTKHKSILVSIRKQLEKFNKTEHTLEKIKNKYLVDDKKSIDAQKFVLEMESFYADLLKDKITIALLQGYDYIAFVEWNQKTKKLNNEEDKLSASDSIQKKSLRDRIFITRLSKTIVFLSNGFRSLENRLF